MERHNSGRERLIVPTDFTSPAGSKRCSNPTDNSTHLLVYARGSQSCRSMARYHSTQQEILELRRENQKLMRLQGHSTRERMTVDHPSDLRCADRREQWSRWESEWRVEAEKHKAEAERLKGQVEALKESAGRHREEMRHRDSIVNRQSHELEAMREELCKAKTELSQIREGLTQSSTQKEKISSQLERLKGESDEEIAKLRRDVERSKRSQMGQAFETQSATLHSLRNYIGQLAPEKGEKERLNDAVERLNKEKTALQMTAELLTVRLNSVNEILALQEERMVKKVRSMEQQLQQEQHRASVFQHSLDDRIAELDLEKVKKETLEQDLVQTRKENSQLKSLTEKAEAELSTLTEAVQRFSLAFGSKVADVDVAQTRLNTLTQRLTFAKRRVETIQGLIMRRVALQKVQQASKHVEQTADSITNLQTELSLVCEERDKLTQELKRTPELIDKTLADLKEQYESTLRQQQQQLEQSWVEVRQAVAGREEAEQSLQQIQAQLEESRVNLEELRSELLSQQEHSERALQERVSEIKDSCAEKLREMEFQVNTAKREHTKAVMTLRLFEKEAARKQDEMKETEHLGSEHRKSEVQNKQPKETEKDKNLLLVTVAERGLTSAHTGGLQNSAAPTEHPAKPSETSRHVGAKTQLPAGERLLSVLEELHSLSAAVVNSSEDSAEEDGQSDSVGPSTGGPYS
ncbi:Coiled-coil alpha-helical rod protein 1 [Collichthys lucidus]|uniref:Coiled-coil alpha-helical rod protein 1 n=1 Tax=Collichthys lucidus TaxID=240159 RepID=A0A4U5V714_COLLU|nr:Coiled-coil alpha-helical rod protein 1 [Collichthys lucidus]